MDRYQASFSPAGGGTRQRSSLHRRTNWFARLLGTGSLAGLAALGPALPAPAMTSRPLPGANSNRSTSAPTAGGFSLVDQTSWVKPGQMFDLTLAIGSPVPRSQLGIALSVYALANGQSSFDQTLQGNTSSEPLVSDTPTVPLTSLPTDGSGNVKIRAGITSGDAAAPLSDFNLDLQCAPQSCGGVYPLRVQLMNTATGSVVVDLVTHIVFVESKVASRLRVALVVPLGTRPALSSGSGAPGPPTGSDLARLSATVGELSSSAAPLTVLAQPQTIQALESGPPDAKSVANGIVALSDEAAIDVPPSTYAWVDPKVLVDTGLKAELSAQSERGDQVMDAARVQLSGNETVIEGALDEETLQALSADGVSHVVVPSNDLVPVTGRFAGPSVQTFGIPIANGRTIDAAQTDPAFQSELTDQQGAGGVLAAHQLLADLALVAFEEPEAAWARGVVLAPPLDWTAPPGFLAALLSGLAAIPVLKPVTLSSFFSEVTRGDDGGNPDDGNGWPSTRQLTKSKPVGSDFPSSSIDDARTKLAGLASVVHASGNLTPLADLLLSAECVLLSPQQQAASISAFDQVVASRADVVALSAVHTIRLTSQTATIPITLIRQVPYPVTVVLDLSSDKLAFLHGTNPQTVTLTQHVQSVEVNVSARASGVFPVVVSVRSPVGGLVIVSTKFTVRSLSTSVVAIALTAVAAAVLLVWWARTLISGRRSRRARRAHGAHSAARRDEREERDEPTPAASEAGAPGAGP